MAGQVDEMTASQYAEGPPFPRFALKNKIVLQTAPTDKSKSGGGFQKKQNSYQEKLTNESYSSLMNLTAEVDGNKVKIFILILLEK
jgi:hypothetical protein